MKTKQYTVLQELYRFIHRPNHVLVHKIRMLQLDNSLYNLLNYTYMLSFPYEINSKLGTDMTEK